MNILSFPPTKNPLQIATTSLCSFNFKPPKTSLKPKHFDARDRVIDFGKYKGKMLGTLPSTYLKWVSKNLRARDFEEWAKLADEVLDDPVYRDRIEWEFAEKLLNGDVKGVKHHSAVSELLEISERFGWDNEDKLGWSKIDFSVLGTSKGGRIPRLGGGRKNESLGSRMMDKGKIESLDSRMMDKEVRRLDGSRKIESLGSRMMDNGSRGLGGSRKIESLDSRMMDKEIRRLGGSRKIESLSSRMMDKEMKGLDGSRKIESLGSRVMNKDGSRKIESLDSRMVDKEIRRLDGSRKIESFDSRMVDKEIRGLDGSRKIESLGSRMMDKEMKGLDESRKIESLDVTMRNEGIRGCNEGVGEARKERRERLRSRRSGGDGRKELRGLMEKMGIEEKNEGRLANSDDFRVKGSEDVDERGNVEIRSRFPGRDGLLKQVLSRRWPSF